MFYILNRIYVLSWVTLLFGGTVWLYPRTGISEPLSDWYGVWRNSQGVPTKPIVHLSGKVVRVTDATSFALRGPDQQWYSIGLVGASIPSEQQGQGKKIEKAPVKEARTRLSELMLSNDVEVALVSMDPQRRGLGIVHLGETNVNALMIESGLLELRREFIKGLPLFDQYALIRADRNAKEQKPTHA